ncbi:N-acetylglucosamine-6-phosphate deacetylase [Paenibacillus contaminans]|uniref:N-acetylglucosamine-6-phosphate deacetylase n=1 Tax=Paenibacillus contaminans TaxID=450362 RepID=A0A329MGR4_9BACL|nr:N-acetylglucosamine-6-phosphate deacetylase [Paenibacillus contaminans]RAV19141.1 N-acetylglucosamine-6-phosphate deacetylase [Paenibacillus contaminans]
MSEQSKGSGRRTIYKNGDFYTPEGIVRSGWMQVDGSGRIKAIGAEGTAEPERAFGDDELVVDLKGRSVLPGLIDVHVHGGGGFSMMDADRESLDGMSRFHALHGTTSFLATTVTDTDERIRQALRNAASAVQEGSVTGAELLGVHLEGPFLNAKRAGAQDQSTIRLPDLAALEQYVNDSAGLIKLVTLAPEMEGGMEAVQWLAARGITVSIGHSDATFEEAAEAVHRGASHTTHHFNGMRPLHHREPGLAGAGMMLPELTTELIADGIHVHPALVKLLFDTKGARGLCMITDAVFCAGLPDGEYEHATMKDGKVYLPDSDSLAGSSLTSIRALQNMVAFTGYPVETILPSFTETPARQCGALERKGTLEPGKDADFIVVDDRLELLATYVRGGKVYER